MLVVTAFVAPPFTGLDTLPSLGVVLISLGVLLEDPILGFIGLLIGAVGVFAVVFLGKEAIHLVRGSSSVAPGRIRAPPRGRGGYE